MKKPTACFYKKERTSEKYSFFYDKIILYNERNQVKYETTVIY